MINPLKPTRMNLPNTVFYELQIFGPIEKARHVGIEIMEKLEKEGFEGGGVSKNFDIHDKIIYITATNEKFIEHLFIISKSYPRFLFTLKFFNEMTCFQTILAVKNNETILDESFCVPPKYGDYLFEHFVYKTKKLEANS